MGTANHEETTSPLVPKKHSKSQRRITGTIRNQYHSYRGYSRMKDEITDLL